VIPFRSASGVLERENQAEFPHSFAALFGVGPDPGRTHVKSATSTADPADMDRHGAQLYGCKRALVGGPLVNIATVTTTSYTDTTLDPYNQTIYSDRRYPTPRAASQIR